MWRAAEINQVSRDEGIDRHRNVCVCVSPCVIWCGHRDEDRERREADSGRNYQFEAFTG
jgi:hypothetical protein